MSHRLRLLTAATSCAFAASATLAQSDMQTSPPGELPPAADLIASALEAIGSEGARSAVNSMTIAAEMDLGDTGGEMEGDRTATIEAKLGLPSRFHLVATVPAEGAATATFDGTHGWDRDPGVLEYDLMDEGEERMFDLIVPHGWLLTFLERSVNFTTEETIDIDGARHYRIAVKDGDTQMDVFIAADTGRFAAVETTDPNGAPVRLTITEWKDFGGLSLPSAARLDQGMGEEGRKVAFAYTTVEYNNVDESAFAMPDEVKRQIAEDDGGAGAAARSMDSSET